MSDKEQIIIDGVDVGGCSVYKNGLCLVTKNKCNAVCDYASYYLREQLARKMQECEELKQTLTEIKEIASKVLLNTHDLEQFKDADALFGALLEIHKKISECEVEND